MGTLVGSSRESEVRGMSNRSQPVVQTVGLCKVFKDFWRRPRVEAVRDLNMEIRPGEVLGLLGPNGSGKSTTIKMLLGLLYPTKGRISVFGQAPTEVAVKARIGFLPEETYLYRFLVAHETLDFFGRLFRLPARIRRDRTERLLDMVGLRHEADRRLGEYSKGMARRIGLAQALINDPELLILDEPTTGLDPIGARQIKDVVRHLGNKGKTILLSSHILADVEDVCDRVVILYGGQQRAAGEINELLRERNVTQITAPALDEQTIEKIKNIVRQSESKNVMEVSNPRVKLEDYFLRIVNEAQAAQVHTFGARAGGAVPDFLQKATDVTADVVDSLVTASASTAKAPEPRALRPLRERPEPDEKVLSELVAPVKPEADGQSGTPVSAVPKRTPSRAVVDQSVLDALLQPKRGPHSDDDKGTP